jgi:hypothetical protein
MGALIGYNLKLPNQKGFIKFTLNEGIEAGKFIVFEGVQYQVKRKFMTNEAGYMIEVTPSTEEVDHLIQVVRRIRYDLL